MCDGLVWAELGAAMPGSGGSYRYLGEIYGPGRAGRLMSFLARQIQDGKASDAYGLGIDRDTAVLIDSHGHGQVYGNVAQRWSHYDKRGVLNGTPFAAQGWISTQFARTSDGWRITAMAWDDEP